ncbi:MAG: hypothetical protein M1823_005050 [Watsoniomyces obsoletus]|nr:MAG: hypothetical protein M1823_005050 [Watsoniomyces obsoletus]
MSLTRSHKLNDRDHSGQHDLNGQPESHLPRYFAKTGPVDADPKKTKKDGGGKGNWGREGDEVQDYGYNFTNPRRRSNSSGHHPVGFKTKFETIDQEPVFEEELHGAPSVEDGMAAAEAPAPVTATTPAAGDDNEKESAASTSVESIEEEDGQGAKHV